MSAFIETPSLLRCAGTALRRCDHSQRAASNIRAGGIGFNGRPTAPVNDGRPIPERTDRTR
ncbi:MAG: hypothetical protein ABI318_11555 [Chthoniobacteraceae bacterium]